MKRKRVFVSILIRSFFVQAIWNFERLQNVGFAFSLLPFFRMLYPDPAKRREVLLRHIGFFNTHPYMVSMIFGIVASLEEDIKEGKDVRPDDLVTLKNNIAGPLAAIGDTFFWATWRPFTVLLAVSLVLIFNRLSNFAGTWLAPVAFIFLYNIIHVPFRLWSLKVSYQLRTRIVEIIADLEFQYAVDMVRFVGVLVLLFTVVYYLWVFGPDLGAKAIMLVLFLAAFVAACFRVSTLAIFYGMTLAGILIGVMRG